MESSIATNGTARAVETTRATSSLPTHLVNDKSAENLLTLINEYYNSLNDEIEKNGLEATFEINNIGISHDVDLCSEKYLEAIRKTIAVGVPTKSNLDKRRLYKIIVDFYLERGSDRGAYDFFRIFYDEIIELIYPKLRLFNTSSDRSKLSDNEFRILDSYYWQVYSYVIKFPNSNLDWEDDYLRFMHPAGLKMFAKLTVATAAYAGQWIIGNESVDGVLGTEYLIDLDADSPLPEISDYWQYIDWDKWFGKYAPIFQYSDINRYLYSKVLMPDDGKHYLEHIRNILSLPGVDKKLLRAFYVIHNINTQQKPLCNHLCYHHRDYLRMGKWREKGSWNGYEKHTIESTYKENNDPVEWNPRAKFQYKGYGTDVIKDHYTYGSVEYGSQSYNSPALNSP